MKTNITPDEFSVALKVLQDTWEEANKNPELVVKAASIALREALLTLKIVVSPNG